VEIVMQLSRAELDAALFQLHASVPLWRDALEDEDALRATYWRLADRIVDSAPTHDRDWVTQQVTAIERSRSV
jgi:hypothetical protein